MKNTAYFHLPGLFEFYDLYSVFLPIYFNHPDYFYKNVKIASIYGAPYDCIWGGGRIGYGDNTPIDVFNLMNKYGISARLTFSNSLLDKEHLYDKKCNALCSLFKKTKVKSGIIIYSDLLLDYIKKNYPDFYFVSSTTKVLTDFEDFKKEIKREDFEYVVPDFRLNHEINKLNTLTQKEKNKVEFLVNECCYIGCKDRKKCYEIVSAKSLGELIPEHICKAPGASEGYKFSKAMESPAFISHEDINRVYLSNGFSNFKIEGRSLGSALILEFLIYYLARPEYHIKIREEIYLSSSLDLF